MSDVLKNLLLETFKKNEMNNLHGDNKAIFSFSIEVLMSLIMSSSSINASLLTSECVKFSKIAPNVLF